MSVADFQHVVLSQQDQLSMLKNGLEGEQWGTPWAVRQSLLLGLSHKQMANWLSVSNSSQNEKHLPLPFSFRAGSCVNCLALFTGSLGLGLWFFFRFLPSYNSRHQEKRKISPILQFMNIARVSDNPSVLALLRFLSNSQLLLPSPSLPQDPKHSQPHHSFRT